MSTVDADSVRQALRDAMRVESFGPPADPAAISAAAERLGVAFPSWLRDLYLACDGFLGPTAWPYLLPLSGHDGVVEFTEFLRGQDWAPLWLNRAVVFGSNVGSGSCTVTFCALGGDLIEWCLGDGAEFTRFDGTVYDLYRREQAGWDEIQSP
jgi:hypothetical protein